MTEVAFDDPTEWQYQVFTYEEVRELDRMFTVALAEHISNKAQMDDIVTIPVTLVRANAVEILAAIQQVVSGETVDDGSEGWDLVWELGFNICNHYMGDEEWPWDESMTQFRHYFGVYGPDDDEGDEDELSTDDG